MRFCSSNENMGQPSKAQVEEWMTGCDVVPRPLRLTDEVARIITERITTGVFRAGEQIPSEKELSESFGVSRTVVREAISRLKHDGLVEARQGTRAFVSVNPAGHVFRIEAPGDVDLAALFDLRICVETHAAELAAIRRCPGDLKQMAEQLACMASPGSESDAKVAADVAFHATIAGAAANTYFARFIEFLGAAFREAIATARSNTARFDGLSAQVQGEHEAIFAAIAAADSMAAATAMSAHLTNARNRLTD
jgi:GntR family transcriptional regulator, transcriptional repressor for pyruvate dehydrogenase complex